MKRDNSIEIKLTSQSRPCLDSYKVDLVWTHSLHT